MGLFFETSEADGPTMKHLPGHHRRRNRTDQQCPHCRRWFSNRGYGGHLPNCPVRFDNFLKYSETYGCITAMVCKDCGCLIRQDRVSLSRNPLTGEEHEPDCRHYCELDGTRKDVIPEEDREAIRSIDVSSL